MLNDNQDNEAVQSRNWHIVVFLAGVGLLFLVLVIRLYSLQFTHYEENLQRSENNRLRKVVLTAERGYIYDRNGNVLVRNRPSYQIALHAMSLPKKKEDRKVILNKLFQGKVTLKFTIAPGGEVISISIASSTTGYGEFDGEIKNAVSRWKFSKVKSGNTTVTIPFTFSE